MNDVIMPKNIRCVCCKVGLGGGGGMPSFLAAPLLGVTALCDLLGSRMHEPAVVCWVAVPPLFVEDSIVSCFPACVVECLESGVQYRCHPSVARRGLQPGSSTGLVHSVYTGVPAVWHAFVRTVCEWEIDYRVRYFRLKPKLSPFSTEIRASRVVSV